MGVEQSKVKCLYLPAQSGKTRKMEDLIRTYKLGDLFEPVDINVIISSNNRVLVEQTRTRMIRDLTTDTDGDACIRGNVFSWTSGTRENNITSVDLAFRILDEEIEMVVLCAHAKRLSYLSKTLARLAKSRKFQKKINIWIDEADNSINLWSKYQNVYDMDCIHQITLVSATFDTVMSRYKHLHVLPYLQTHPECYRGLKDVKRCEVNVVVENPLEYVQHVMSQFVDRKLMNPGMRAFIPGSNSTTSHDEIADYLHKNGFVVIIINGQRKEILIPGHNPIDLRCYFTVQTDHIPQEFNTQLSMLYKENNWARFPLAVTGCLCVRRGVTFQSSSKQGLHDGFLFDYGIIPPMITNAADAYQTMARVFGNTGEMIGYKPVEVFANSATFSRVEKQEEIAINIARLVAEQGLAIVTKKDIRAAQNCKLDSLFDLHTGEFTTFEEAVHFLRELGAQRKSEKSLVRDNNGFILSSTTGTKRVLHYDDVVKDMSGWAKTSNFDVKKEKRPTKPMGRLYVCYKDLNSVSSVVFMCRVLVPR